jgi:hypothetical protein
MGSLLQPQYLPPDSPEFFIVKLEEALGVADGQPLTFTDIIERLRTIWADYDRQLVLTRLEHMAQRVEQPASSELHLPMQRRLPEGRQEQLAKALTDLVSIGGSLPARDRDRADRAVARLSRLLSVDRAWSAVEPWFGDPRVFRRRVVVRVLLEHGVPHSLAAAVVDQYRVTQERGLLKLISQNPHVAALLDESDVLGALAVPSHDYQIGAFLFKDRDARYWRMRAIEAYLIGGHVPSDDLGLDHPMEFAWAVGRQSHKASLPLLRRVLTRYLTDPEFIWRCIRAFDRVGDAKDVKHIRALASSLVESVRLTQPPNVVA